MFSAQCAHRTFFGWKWGLLAVLLPRVLAAAGPPADPVEELRQALRVPVRDPNNQDELALRKAELDKRVKALRTLGQLYQALSGTDDSWRDLDQDPNIQAVDRSIRENLVSRLEEALRQRLMKGDGTTQLAAITLTAEMGATARDAGTHASFARRLAPELIRLAEKGQAEISAAAARALGKVHPDPKLAVPALASLLRKDGVTQRRGAARGLANMVSTSQIARYANDRQQQALLSTKDLTTAAREAVPVAGGGIADADPEVRRSCLETLHQAAALLDSLIVDRRAANELPPKGRKLTPDEQSAVEAYVQEVEQERKRVSPLVKVLNDEMKAVAAAVNDADDQACLAAYQVLETLGDARLRLLRRGMSSMLAGEKKGPDDLLPDVLKTIPELAKVLSNRQRDVRVRLGVLYALESLESDAAPAVVALVGALEDKDPFVRWGAARVLRHVAPREAARAVPALAKRLQDENGDVRVTVLSGLTRYGPAAKSAAPALAEVIKEGKGEIRVLAIRALTAIGPGAKPETSSLVIALAAREVTVRREAARALSRLGKAAHSEETLAALRKALGDADAEVRQWASQAMLADK